MNRTETLAFFSLIEKFRGLVQTDTDILVPSFLLNRLLFRLGYHYVDCGGCVTRRLQNAG